MPIHTDQLLVTGLYGAQVDHGKCTTSIGFASRCRAFALKLFAEKVRIPGLILPRLCTMLVIRLTLVLPPARAGLRASGGTRLRLRLSSLLSSRGSARKCRA